MSEERFEVQHRGGESRYVLVDRGESGSDSKEAGEERYLDLDDAGSPQRIFFHTGVDEAYGGQGLASVLVQNAVDQAIAGGRKIVPVCPYVAGWVKKHPEYAEHVVQPRPDHLRALSQN